MIDLEWWRSKKTYRLALLVILPLLAVIFLYRVRAVLTPFLLAMVIAYLINPLVQILESRKFPRGVAILIIYLALGLIIGLMFFYAVPELVKELSRFATNLPKYMQEAENHFRGIRQSYYRVGLPDGIARVFDEKLDQGERVLAMMVKSALNGVLGLFSSLLSIIFAPIFAYYILRDLANIKKSLIGVIPKAYRTETMALFRDIDDVLSKFVRSHLTVCAIIGISTGIGMALIGVDFAFVIGLIAGITDLIPYIGPFIGAIPAVALALLKSPATVLYVIVVITLIQQLESNIITPRIVGNSLGLHPLLVIFVLLAGGELFGILGMLLALPVTAVAKVVFNYLYLKLVG